MALSDNTALGTGAISAQNIKDKLNQTGVGGWTSISMDDVEHQKWDGGGRAFSDWQGYRHALVGYIPTEADVGLWWHPWYGPSPGIYGNKVDNVAASAGSTTEVDTGYPYASVWTVGSTNTGTGIANFNNFEDWDGWEPASGEGYTQMFWTNFGDYSGLSLAASTGITMGMAYFYPYANFSFSHFGESALYDNGLCGLQYRFKLKHGTHLTDTFRQTNAFITPSGDKWRHWTCTVTRGGNCVLTCRSEWSNTSVATTTDTLDISPLYDGSWPMSGNSSHGNNFSQGRGDNTFAIGNNGKDGTTGSGANGNQAQWGYVKIFKGIISDANALADYNATKHLYANGTSNTSLDEYIYDLPLPPH